MNGIFSISSHPDQDIISIHIKVNQGGRWTQALCKLIKDTKKKYEMLQAVKSPKNKSIEWYKKINIQIEGSHGHLTLRKPLHEYKHIIFIGGGIGITPLHSLFNQLISDLSKSKDKLSSDAQVKHIEFIFTTRSKAMITEFARKNKAWDIVNDNNDNDDNDDNDDSNEMDEKQIEPTSINDLDPDELLNFSANQDRIDLSDIEEVERMHKMLL